jgi:hypothetical protein
MYNCFFCGATSPPRAKRILYPVWRTNAQGYSERAAEWPVCSECKEDLDTGIVPRIMLQELRPRAERAPIVIRGEVITAQTKR